MPLIEFDGRDMMLLAVLDGIDRVTVGAVFDKETCIEVAEEINAVDVSDALLERRVDDLTKTSV